MNTNQYIAKAVYDYLRFNAQSTNSSRRFFRIDGFDEDVYQKLLDIFRSSHNVLADLPLWVHTTAPISGYLEYALQSRRSATWYRNHVPSGHALVLIFNKRTSDEQSLKDIYRVTEGLLAIEEQIYLINATCVDYQLFAEQIDAIKKFLEQLGQKLFQPQLRDLVNFLLSLNTYLHKNPTASIESAIAQSLPQFGLFRCPELASKLNTSKGNRLLLDVFRASQLGTQNLDFNQLNTYLNRLKNARLDDYNGQSAEQKRGLIQDFLTEVITDPTKLLQIFQIDWNEVADIFFEKTRKSKAEQLQDLAEMLQDALETQHFTKESLPEVISCTLEDLKGGRGPKEEDLDDLLIQYGDILPGTLKNRLRRLRGVKKIQGTDFIANLLLMAIELVSSVQSEVSEEIVLKVEFDPDQLGKLGKDKAEVLLAFRTLYGGVESLIPSIRWNIGEIWEVARQSEGLIEDDDQGQEGGQEKIVNAELAFHVTALNKEVLESAELVWLYRSDGPTATTLAHVRTEAKRLANEKRLSVPIYNTCPITDDMNDLDLSRPIVSFGVWYREFTRLRDVLRDSLAHVIEPKSWDMLEHALDQLEEAWGSFIRKAATIGILAAGLDELLAEYEKLLGVAAELLRSRQEATYAYRVLTRAWMVGPKHFDEWSFVPFLHPLKLHWWYERSRYFNTLIAQLIDPTVESPIVDERKFRQELYSSYGSANYPAILALPGRDLQPHYFLPVHEIEGYELFRRMEDASLAYGLDPNLVSEDEGSQATKIAASELAHVVNDYLETYPYVYDGLQIYVIQCRNGALPGLLIEHLKELTHRHKKLCLNLVIHTIDRGAPLYQNAMEWLKSHEEFTGRSVDTYFPQVTLTVLQCSYEELFQKVKDTDIVILPDVLAENGQLVKAKAIASQLIPLDLDGYFPIYNIQRAPFERQELVRDILLNPLSQPLLLQRFYNIQWAAQERDIVPTNEAISFTIQVSLQDWEKKLAELHEHFRWVVCYDTAVDRFLLEATLKSSVQVIRYSLGLGIKRRHNLTVSSSYKAQDVVERRLTINLETLVPGTHYDFRNQVAQNLITQAKQVSGDIVLRAAGPGAYLNELIGMVAAKHLTEQRYLQQHPGALYTWIYLDDFSHWFEHKLPDLLFVAIPAEINGKLPLHIEIIETKCISEAYFDSEALDAQRQIAQGVNRLGQAWAPGRVHLDAPYWYDQLYQAVVGNLAVHRNQLHLWEAFRHRLPKGDFTLEMSGHTWIFCYDRVSGMPAQTKEGVITKNTSDTEHVPQYYHHYRRSDLRRVLRELVEAWQLVASPEMWKAEDSMEGDRTSNISPEENSKTSKKEATDMNVLVQQKLFSESSEPLGSESIDNGEKNIDDTTDINWLQDKARDLEHALRHYNFRIHPIDPALADIGPSIIRFKLRLRPGEQINKIQRIANDLARELSLTNTPLIANIPGTIYVGIDLPRQKPQTVYLQPLLSQLSHSTLGELPIIIGQTPDGKTIVEDLSEFPHLLVAGTTNSGKSVFLRSLILCLLSQYTSENLRLLIVDPKRTDFSFFNGLPHLIGGRVIVDQNEARSVLLDLVQNEMPRRQKILENRSTRLKDFNQRYPKEALPPIVAVIDEYARLLTSISKKQDREAFEQDLMSLAAVARATGIHLVLATQRPSADVVTGTLKANLPVSIAFKVASAVNSRIVIDQGGAENLLGRGDMLFRQPDGELSRLQAPFVDEISIQNYLTNLRNKLH